MTSHSFICGKVAPGDEPSTALLVCFDWMLFCFDICWPGEKDGMVYMTKISRSNTSFQKVKCLFRIYNSSKIIGSNIFYFQKTCYMFELTCPSGSCDKENYLNVYVSLLKCLYHLTFPTF